MPSPDIVLTLNDYSEAVVANIGQDSLVNGITKPMLQHRGASRAAAVQGYAKAAGEQLSSLIVFQQRSPGWFGRQRLPEPRWAKDGLLDSLHASMRGLQLARVNGLPKDSVADLVSARKLLNKVLFSDPNRHDQLERYSKETVGVVSRKILRRKRNEITGLDQHFFGL